MQNFVMTLLPLLGFIAVVLFIGIVAAKLYTRSSQERAFVRTGLGGLKVVMSGGAMVLPIFHEIIWVNRNTLRLPVDRNKHQSLITKDRLRVDVSAEFYVRVAQTAEAVAIAAQTLGRLTMNPNELRDLVEGKFVDALRSAASAMTMEELHEKRAEFVQNVKQAVSQDLAENGLELESVSLTGLNQTQKEFFDKDNVFDAEGLLKMTGAIETRNKARNDIEQDTKVQIAQKDLTATQAQLTLKLQREQAILETDRDIASAAAATQAAIAQTAAEGRRQAEEANLTANQQIAERRISTERTVETAEAVKMKDVQTAVLDAKTAVELRGQEQSIVVANKSQELAAAEALADEARAKAVSAEESVETARQVATANRQKQVTLVKAEERAQETATGITIAAEADRKAAGDRAEAQRVQATADRDASLLRAEGTVAEGNAVAAALLAKNEAQNKLAPELVNQQVKLAVILALPGIIEQSVKPMEKIDSIRISEVGGLYGNGSGNSTTASGSAGNGGLGNEMVNAALSYRTNQPLVDALLGHVGLSTGGDMSKLVTSVGALAGVHMASDTPVMAIAAPVATVETD